MENFGLTALVIGGAILLLPFLDSRDERARAALFALCIALTWRYVGWRFLATLPPLALRVDSLYAWGFWLVEALANIGWTLGFVTLARTRDRSREATDNTAWLERRERPPRVDVLIATFNEDAGVLTRSIVGALAIDWPGTRVWVLDDGRRPWLAELCASKGANYLTRPDNRDAKAGNINHAVDFLRDRPDPPEFVATFDADFVAQPEFLRRTLPLFHAADVGVVQTPQHFFNRDPIQSNLLIGHVWPDEQRFFFDHVMQSKDAWGAAFYCGTSSVIRVRALEEAGGFPTESVTEDFLLTLELERHRWRTVYLNEQLSAGLAPEGMQEYVTQRGRWCLGLMQIVRSPLGPLSRGRLPLAYRISLLDALLYWAASFPFKLLCLLVPIIYWFTGLTVGTAPAAEILRYFVPYYAAVMITLYWVTGGLVQPILTDVSHVLTMPAALRATVGGLLRPRGRRFEVTQKGGRRDRVRVQWAMLGRFGLLAGLTLAGMLYGSLADYAPGRQPVGSIAIILFWSVYNIIVLLLAMSVCIELPRYRREERFRTSELVSVIAGGRVLRAALADISAGGAHILAPSPGRRDDIVAVRLDGIGELAARIVAASDSSFAIEFVDAEAARDALIRKVFSGRYYPREREVRGRRLLRALVARALR